ncbi:MAG: hypothetical protein H0T89_20525 [Deltaproteobacteria bacterium]|nr:hypothetical protein [Deltaproteobacteria bacterium]
MDETMGEGGGAADETGYRDNALVLDGSDDTDETDGDDGGDDGDGDGDGSLTPPPTSNCPAYGSDVYTPYPGSGPFPTGKVSTYPWRGPTTAYPNGMEDFSGYAALPLNVECGGTRTMRNYLDVTAGCLDAVPDAANAVGRVQGTSAGYFRTFALGYAPGETSHRVLWTDQGAEYRFFYATGATGNTGFKVFTRYRTEYDLYVASWRMDGVVQIQKKQCGEYTVLAKIATYGAPSPNAWHTIRFEAVGNRLELYLDNTLAITATDDTFSSGTAGIRIDSMNGALIDDWRVYAP